MTYSPSSMSTHAEKWEKEDIKSKKKKNVKKNQKTELPIVRTRKIRIYPNISQKTELTKWINTSRYVYNKCISAIKEKSETLSFYNMRNSYVTGKRDNVRNENVEDWELETPKDVRAGAIRDLEAGFVSSLSNLSSGNINHFKMTHRKKKFKNYSIEVPHTAVFIKDKKLFVYSKKYIKEGIQMSNDKSIDNIDTIDHTCRIKNENNRWFVCIPIKRVMDTTIPHKDICALDPGTRKFQTIYSSDEVIVINHNNTLLENLRNKISYIQSLKNIRKRTKNKKIRKIYYKIGNLVDDMHFKIISYLTKTYKCTFLPKFESQELIKKNHSKRFRYTVNIMKHFKFQQRFKDCCNLKKYSKVEICKEDYTTTTCTKCGSMYDIGKSEVYDCPSCKLHIDRDMHQEISI